jgi:hypothetical protein
MEQHDEIDKFIDKLIHEELCNIITTKIAPYTCQLLVRNSHDELIPFASGVMVKLEKSYYIFTASHVIEDWSDVNPLFLEINNAYRSVVGKGCGTEIEKEQRLDVAYIKLKNAIVPILKQRYRFLTIGKFFYQDKLLLEADYCVFGYPVSIQKKQNGILMPKGAAYFVRPLPDKVFTNYNLDFLTHYILEIKGKAINIKTAITEKLKTEHYGLSGGGLWYITIKLSGKKLRSQAYLIGIMTEFRKGKFECLIANRIEILLRSLHQNECLKMKTK